jgi:hypothetical protein
MDQWRALSSNVLSYQIPVVWSRLEEHAAGERSYWSPLVRVQLSIPRAKQDGKCALVIPVCPMSPMKRSD